MDKKPYRCLPGIFFALLTVAILPGFAPQRITAQENLKVLTWRQYSDVKNALYREIAQEAFRYLDQRERGFNAISSQSDYRAYYSSVKRKLDEAFGPMPEKTPLNARVTGTFEHEGIIVEKIIYESRPGFQVTGAVFKKKGLTSRLPAILYVCGHSVDGFRSEAYQHIILSHIVLDTLLAQPPPVVNERAPRELVTFRTVTPGISHRCPLNLALAL